MKIDQQLPVASIGTNQVSESAAASTDLTASKRSLADQQATSDSVNLSSPFRLLQRSTEARANRVNQLTQSVQGGDYSVSPTLISRSLVQETLAGAAQ
jgi:anti-sigma28 factor (negative regulator of flagellin synthesis)